MMKPSADKALSEFYNDCRRAQPYVRPIAAWRFALAGPIAVGLTIAIAVSLPMPDAQPGIGPIIRHYQAQLAEDMANPAPDLRRLRSSKGVRTCVS